MSKNLEKICSYCGQEKPTVDRNMFDGLCADCTDKALNCESVNKFAKTANERLKNGEKPYDCPCESTRAMGMCDDTTCDGIYFWSKD